tara:strand:+ start:3182 stop:3358 length:177 start_codon:yes stop_codon:yes gene_type:complete
MLPDELTEVGPSANNKFINGSMLFEAAASEEVHIEVGATGSACAFSSFNVTIPQTGEE